MGKKPEPRGITRNPTVILGYRHTAMAVPRVHLGIHLASVTCVAWGPGEVKARDRSQEGFSMRYICNPLGGASMKGGAPRAEAAIRVLEKNEDKMVPLSPRDDPNAGSNE